MKRCFKTKLLIPSTTHKIQNNVFHTEMNENIFFHHTTPNIEFKNQIGFPFLRIQPYSQFKVQRSRLSTYTYFKSFIYALVY